MADIAAAQGVSTGAGSSRDGDVSNELMACRRCRKQKVRCSKERPTCRRCRLASAICAYPPPPDRKLLGAQRAQNAKAHTHPESEGSNMPGRASTSNNTGRNLALQEAALPSADVALFLIEIYFSHIWNAALMFHKPTFSSDYLNNKVPDFLSLSIFALASIFLQETLQQPRLDESSIVRDTPLLSATYYSGHSREWATAASRLVLARADEPYLETIQACQNLAYYWFSVGHLDRSSVHRCIAYRTCRQLGFHSQPVSGSEIDPLLSEIKRRCFWSCWTTNCISQDNACFKAGSWKEVVGLPLPSDEASFLRGHPKSKEFLDDNGDVLPIRIKPDQILAASIMGELAKILGLWWEIQNFVKQYVDDGPHDFPEKISTLLALDRRLEIGFENLDASFRYIGPQSFTYDTIDPYKVFLLNCVYHLCACVLHSSIVPLFSTAASDPQISKKFVRMSAGEAFKHSMLIIDMAAGFLSISPDISRLSSVTGYALFVSSSVQFKSLSAQGRLYNQRTSRFNAALLILKHLKGYWRPLQGLWTSLGTLFSSANINIDELSTGEGHEDTPLDLNTNIDHIVSQQAVSQGSTRHVDLYTYVANLETSAVSPGRGSASINSQEITQQAQDAASTLKAMKESAINQELESPMQSGDSHSPGPSGASNYPYRPAAQQPQLYHAPPPQSPVSNSPLGVQPGFDNLQVLSAGNLTAFAPISSASDIVAHPMPLQGQGQRYAMHVEPMAMEIDDRDLWWNHSFENIETDPYEYLLPEYPWGEEAEYPPPSG